MIYNKSILSFIGGKKCSHTHKNDISDSDIPKEIFIINPKLHNQHSSTKLILKQRGESVENHSLTSILCHSPMNTKEVLFNTYIETGAEQSGKCISEDFASTTRSDLLWNCTTDSDEIKLADDQPSSGTDNEPE